MKIIVLRTGNTWHGEGSTAGTLTSQGNHDAVVHELARAGHEVLAVGRIAGQLTCGAQYQLSWNIKPELGVAANVPELDALRRACTAWKPDALVNVVGADVTNTTPTNKRGNIVQASMWRYYWPGHEIMRELQLPRICVVTDCRCYPREQEMLDDTWALPAAVLSQESGEFVRRVLHGKLYCRTVYAGVERFRLRGRPLLRPAKDAQLIAVALAHAHMKDKRIWSKKQETWERLSTGCKIHAFGEGWDEFDNTGTELYARDAVPHNQIDSLLNSYVAGPLVPMLNGWLSPKYGEYARAGCLPLPVGRGQPLTYDIGGCMVPLDSQLRVTNGQDLNELIRRCSDYEWRCDQVDLATARSEPDPSLLLECVEHFGKGGQPDFDSFNRFGGMRWNGE